MRKVRVSLHGKECDQPTRLYNLRLEKGKLVKSHLDEFYSIVMDFKKIDLKFNDEDSDI